MFNRRSALTLFGGALATPALLRTGYAQGWAPSRAIRLVVA